MTQKKLILPSLTQPKFLWKNKKSYHVMILPSFLVTKYGTNFMLFCSVPVAWTLGLTWLQNLHEQKAYNFYFLQICRFCMFQTSFEHTRDCFWQFSAIFEEFQSVLEFFFNFGLNLKNQNRLGLNEGSSLWTSQYALQILHMFVNNFIKKTLMSEVLAWC